MPKRPHITLALVMVVASGCSGRASDRESPGQDGGAAPERCAKDVDCSAPVECHTVSCVGGVCVTEVAEEGATCAEDDPCLQAASCVAGECVGDPVECGHLGDACNVGTCDPSEGCVAVAVADSTPCYDGDPCTVDDVCVAGGCEPGAPMDCSVQSDACNVGYCDDATGACAKLATNEGEACSDGAFCTVDDVCVEGACLGEVRDCSAGDTVCGQHACNDDTDACELVAVNEGQTCDDGSFCTVDDSCAGGACVGVARDCSAVANTCNEGVCDDAADACLRAPANEGAACDDGLYCTIADACAAGACVGGSARDCSDSDPCTTDSCNEFADDCAHAAVAPLPDAEGLGIAGTCDDSVDNDCDGATDVDDDDCRTCTPGSDCCECTADGDCDDGNACTSDTCVGSCSCSNTPLTGPSCDDGLYCTEVDTCDNGVCTGTTRDCSGLTDTCNTGTCDEVGDACVATPANEGGGCDDGLYCTVSDACASGTCTGSARDCSGLDDACNTGGCDDGSDACVAQPVGDGTACTLDLCSTGDTCTGGTCGGGTPVDCSDGDACTADVCVPATGCEWPALTIDKDSAVAASSSDPSQACMVASSDARLLVWTDLRTPQDTAIGGATVTIAGSAATESTSQPGIYYVELLAPAAPSTMSLGVDAVACGDSQTLNQTVALTVVDENTNGAGPGGCASMDGNLRVTVVNLDTGAPVSDASVLVGMAESSDLEHSAEAPFGGTASASTNRGVTDGNGQVLFYDFGLTLHGTVAVTAGEDATTYFTIIDNATSDVILGVRNLDPPPLPTTTYTDGGVTSFHNKGFCDGNVDAALVLRMMRLDELSSFSMTSMLERNRCGAFPLVGEMALPSNVYIAEQAITLCMGISEAPWALTLPNSSATGEPQHVFMSTVTLAVSALTSGGGLTDALGAVNFMKAGFWLNETVPTAPLSGRIIDTDQTFNSTFTVSYSGEPAGTDVVGVLLGDYEGGNGTGPMFPISMAVHGFDDAGSAVGLENIPMTSGNRPASVRRLVSMLATYMEPATTGTNRPVAPGDDEKLAVSSVLVRDDGGGNPPVGDGSGSTSVTTFMALPAATFDDPGSFSWANATANGTTPQFSIHSLRRVQEEYMPLLSCETVPQVYQRRVLQWEIMRRFGADCADDTECFALPTLPADFPRAATAGNKRSGMMAANGSGTTCAGDGECSCPVPSDPLTCETCKDPDGAGSMPSMCLLGTGVDDDNPYSVQYYEWAFGVYQLGLLPGSFSYDSMDTTTVNEYVTHSAANTIRLP